MYKGIDLIGERFGRLTVIEKTEKRRHTEIVWRCRCDSPCNNIVDIRSGSLKSGNTQSCGCLAKELTIERSTRHGAYKGYERQPLYKIFESAKDRCYNAKCSSYNNYGGRGITICEEWLNNYSNFRDYMLSLENCPSNALVHGSTLSRSIDRINNDGNYEPRNVRWATRKEQQNNRRITEFFKVNGKRMCFNEAVLCVGKASHSTIRQRLCAGWDCKKAFLTPSKRLSHAQSLVG
jgi:hypothetical protein